MPHGRGIRAHMDVFTACPGKGLHFMSRAIIDSLKVWHYDRRRILLRAPLLIAYVLCAT